MFGTQAMRLRRTEWKTAKLLAEELYAMFQADIPLEHEGGLTLKGGEARPALTLTRGDFGDGPVLTWQSTNGGEGGVRLQGQDVIVRGKQVVVEWDDADGTTRQQRFPITSGQDEQTPPASTYPAQVIRPEGTQYLMRLYRNGTSGVSAEVLATALGLAEDAELDEDTWAMVSAVQVGERTAYYFTPLVWGSD